MKTKMLISFVSLLMILQSCTPPVLFEQPQPQGNYDLSEFPNRIKGLYKNNSDGFLEVSSKTVVMKYNMDFELPHSELDSSTRFKMNGDVLTDAENNLNILVKLINDTLRGRWQSTDTIFNLSDENPLRKFKGNYFLNAKQDDGWQVIILSPAKNKISLNYISSQDELNVLRAVTDVDSIMQADSSISHYQINPTKKELKLFLQNSNGFNDGDLFVRVD